MPHNLLWDRGDVHMSRESKAWFKSQNIAPGPTRFFCLSPNRRRRAVISYVLQWFSGTENDQRARDLRDSKRKDQVGGKRSL